MARPDRTLVELLGGVSAVDAPVEEQGRGEADRSLAVQLVVLDRVLDLREQDLQLRSCGVVVVPIERHQSLCAFDLTINDPTLDTYRTDRQRPWRGFIVPPGEDMTAIVAGHVSMTIRYRRAGPLGIFERREITMHGLG